MATVGIVPPILLTLRTTWKRFIKGRLLGLHPLKLKGWAIRAAVQGPFTAKPITLRFSLLRNLCMRWIGLARLGALLSLGSILKFYGQVQLLQTLMWVAITKSLLLRIPVV